MATDGEIGVDDEDLLLGVRDGMDEGVVFGRRSSGGFDIRNLGGEKVSANISCHKLRHLEYRKALLVSYFSYFERRGGASSHG